MRLRRCGPSWSAVLLLPLCVASCDDPPAPPARFRPREPAPAAAAPAPVDTSEEATATAAAQADPDAATPAAQALMPPQQPFGVAFPIPDPLPSESLPRALASPGPGLQPGPAPLQGWLGGTGSADGQFTYPRAITTAPEGTFYVVDKTGRIQKFDPDGRLLAVARTPEIGQGMPTELSVAPSGDLIVADTHYCRVLIYSPELRLRRAFGVPGTAPGQLCLLTSAAQAPDGRFFTTDYGDYVARVQVWAEDGTHLGAAGTFGTGPGELRRPMSLCLDRERDAVYVADAVNHRIAVFSRDLTWRGALAGPDVLRYPYSVVQDERGRLWVAEFGGHRVSVLDRDTGAILGRWGQPGRALGALSNPWGVDLGPGERVWVLDSGNDRVYALPRAAVLGAGGNG